MGESKRPSRSSKRPPKMPGPPPLPGTTTGTPPNPNAKRINLRDLRQGKPGLMSREPSDRPSLGDRSAQELGEALVLAKRSEDRAATAESERDEARMDAHIARAELATLQKKVSRLEAELALVRANPDVKADPRKSSADLRQHVGVMVQGIADLRNALIQAAADLETLHEREQETAALRERILTGAAALLVKAVGQAVPEARDDEAMKAATRPPSSFPTFAKSAAALILPPDSGNVRGPASSSADIEVTIDISEVQELIESLIPSKT